MQNLSFLRPLRNLIILGLMAGCASKAEQQQPAPSSKEELPADLKKSGSDKDEDDKNRQSGSGSEEGEGESVKPRCLSGNEGLGLYEEGSEKLNGKELHVYTGRDKTTKSLCDVVSETGKKVAIFQFAGVDCISCRDEARAVREFIASSRYGKDIAHVVVITDLFEDYADNEFEQFMSAYAQGSIDVYDESKIWKHFSEDPSTPNRATVLAFSLDNRATVFNKEGKFKEIFGAAEELARAYNEKFSD